MNPNLPYERFPSLDFISFNQSCVVIADEHLPDSLLSRLPDPILVKAGEQMKTLRSIEEIAAKVLARRSSRPMTLVAVGGGSVGDAVGFLASILWRGVNLWLLPTTLLAMVDSAHGGKTGVNLSNAKNQLGTFYPAERIIIIEEFLACLPLRQRREGLAELLKALLIGDAETVSHLTPSGMETLAAAEFADARAVLMPLLEKAIACKLAIVLADPHETKGIRTVLNLGHSLGHALELTAAMSHGDAVAFGLTAAIELSADFGLDERNRRHLQSLVYPLLQPLRTVPSQRELIDVIAMDKKRSDETLRSVVLQAPARPIVTETLSAEEWIRTFDRVYQRFLSSPVTVRLPFARRVLLTVEASKSELNRALMIAAQRPGRTTIIGKSRADDVAYLLAGLRALGIPVTETADGYEVDHRARELEKERPVMRTVHCGDGGTTLRFFLALAAMNRKQTTLYASPALLRRPHEALIRALRNGGAHIERFDDGDGSGYRVTGWDSMPSSFSVDASHSSQYASAIALLACGSEAPFTLRLLGKVVSASYFDMTVAMLESVGVETIRGNDLVAFNPTDRLNDPASVRVAPDASSAAVWRVAQFFEHPLLLEEGDGSLQPDADIGRYLDAIIAGQKDDEIMLDCTEAPDLVPLLAVAALRSMKPVRLTGIAHVRHKESNRIEGLISSFAKIGIQMQSTTDDLRIPGMASRNAHIGLFETNDDHRLVMAGFLLTMVVGEIDLSSPWSVSKSYPDFWADARHAGWSVAAGA